MKKINLDELLSDMKTYEDLVTQGHTLIKDNKLYGIIRDVRNDIKTIYEMDKGDFNYYYRMSRGRL